MEIEIPLSVKVIVAEDKANINDIVKAIGGILQEMGVYLLKQVLKEWEERIIAAFCAGKATVGHRRKGRRGRDCQGRKGWIRKGETGRERGFTTRLWRPASTSSGLVRARTLSEGGDGDKTKRHRPGCGSLLPARVQAYGESWGC